MVKYLVCSLLVVATATLAPLPGSDAHATADIRSELTGDYLFEESRFRAVFLGHVFESDGSLHAQFGIVDDPCELVPVNEDAGEYSARLAEGNNVFAVTFRRDADGRVTELLMNNDASGVEMTGRRVELPLARLRERYAGTDEQYVYDPPLEIEGDWPVGTLEEVGIDPALLNELMADIAENADFLESVLIVKDGKLVFEEYLNGWDPLRLHRLQSVTKSVTSTMVGLAIREGVIGSLEDPLHEYLPEYAELFDEAKSEIRIEHLLTMTAGFEWNEEATYYDKPEVCDPHVGMASGDFIKYVLEKPMATEPGAVYEYNSALPNILGHIIELRAGMNLFDFAQTHLFGPLGVQRAFWQVDGKKHRPGCAGGLRMTSRDMARYGLLHLQDGMWNGEQILDPDWVRESVKWRVDTGDGGYGYFWDRYVQGEFDAFLASGTGGQYIVCVPSCNAVVVTTARWHTAKSDEVAGMLIRYVVPTLMAAE